MFFHRDGRPITTRESLTQLYRNMETPGHPDERIVARWESPDGEFLVSTVFLGINLSLRFSRIEGTPLLFETMVFHGGNWGGVDCQRYETESMARAGHDALVAEICLIEGIECSETKSSNESSTEPSTAGSEPSPETSKSP